MSLINALPVISQTKSLVQAFSGDAKGARKTQEDFSRTCPVVSQVRSVVEVIRGDKKAARATQMEFLQTAESVIDSLPVVGHVKGGIHYMVGEREAGHNCMKAASRTTGVVAGAVAGFAAAGPPGAAAGAVAGGAAMDGITTGVDSVIHKQYRPNGTFQSVAVAVRKVEKGEHAAGEIFDAVAGVALDAITGYCVGKALARTKANAPASSPLEFISDEAGSNQGAAQAAAANSSKARAIKGAHRMGKGHPEAPSIPVIGIDLPTYARGGSALVLVWESGVLRLKRANQKGAATDEPVIPYDKIIPYLSKFLVFALEPFTRDPPSSKPTGPGAASQPCEQASAQPASASHTTMVNYVAENQFHLRTGGCKHGLTAALFQREDDGKLRLVDIKHQQLRDGEDEWHELLLGFCAFAWAIEEFHPILQGGRFTWHTSHEELHSMLGIMEQPHNRTHQARLVAIIQQYPFDIKHVIVSEIASADCCAKRNSLFQTDF